MRERYDCKENDNHILVELDDQGRADELLIGDPIEKDWTIIGIADIKECLESYGYVVQEKI